MGDAIQDGAPAETRTSGLAIASLVLGMAGFLCFGVLAGIPALIEALGYRLYAHINRQEVLEVTTNRCVFRMNDCRVQSARKRKGLPDFPCKPVGIVEYETFAKTIDPRIKTRCITCPPDDHPEDYYCAWEFYIED